MENPIEQSPERIPTKAEVMEVINRFTKDIPNFAENSSLRRELSDEQGLYLLEMKVEGAKPGETTEYMYMRKGIFPNQNQTLETAISAIFYQDGEPVGGDTVAVYSSETGEWEAVK